MKTNCIPLATVLRLSQRDAEYGKYNTTSTFQCQAIVSSYEDGHSFNNDDTTAHTNAATITDSDSNNLKVGHGQYQAKVVSNSKQSLTL